MSMPNIITLVYSIVVMFTSDGSTTIILPIIKPISAGLYCYPHLIRINSRIFFIFHIFTSSYQENYYSLNNSTLETMRL